MGFFGLIEINYYLAIMKLTEVTDKKTAKEFLMLPVRLYNNEKTWIRPLDSDIDGIFDPQNNKTFRNGELIRWILQDNSSITIGRVAAFINKKTINKGNDQPVGGMGFFECVDNQEAAKMLFDACRDWLSEKGMEAMEGPINFGDRDKWWGLLVEGFDLEPNYGCNYNFPYYQKLFENYGFQLYYRQLTYARKVLDPLSPRLHEKAERIFKDSNYTFQHMKLKEIDKYTEYFRQVYNKAWAGHKGVPQLSSVVAKHLMKQMKPIIDEKIMMFGFYKDEPIAIFIMLPEVNQIFKYVNGKMNLIGKMKFLYHKYRKTCQKMLGLIFGVIPEFQGKGVEGALIEAERILVQEKYLRYEDLEMNWIGDFNPKMIHVVEQVGGYVSKVNITYRYLFDRSKPFTRHPIIGRASKKTS